MPSCLATRRASSAASNEQQDRLLDEAASALSRRIQTPTTSAPLRATNAAATDDRHPRTRHEHPLAGRLSHPP
jgi:hypothetical protein